MSSRAGWRTDGRPLVDGAARATALVLDEPLSLWGGLDVDSGLIVEARHPQVGCLVAGTVLVMTAGRGSSSSSSVLAQALRQRTGPAAIVLSEPDAILAVGALVAQLLDNITCPITVISLAEHRRIATGDDLTVHRGGAIEVVPAGQAAG